MARYGPQLSVRLPPSSRIAAPASGSAISSQSSSSEPVAARYSPVGSGEAGDSEASTSDSTGLLVLEQVRVVDRGRPAAAEDAHDDGEPDDDLGRGDDHDEERHDLAVEGAGGAAEGDQGQVDRVEHQLDAHEDEDRVAAHQHADTADGEQQRGEDQVVGLVHS